ncbi:MAG: Ig-like domain-containing protein, partial [Lutibacter sp.]
AGTVSYSGTTATFNPTNDLTGGLVYTATVTTGAKDLAGNAIATSKMWSFTTLAPVVTGLSFANDVMPTLSKCNQCHTHPWTTSTVASTYYTNLVNGGYVDPTSYASSKIYKKLIGGHPGGTSISTVEINKILDWMKEGSKNN